MNPYSDIPFYVQSLLSDEDDYGVVLLLTLTPRYMAPEEYVDCRGVQIRRKALEKLRYEVKREQLPVFKIPEKPQSLASYALPIMRRDPPGGTLIHMSPVVPCPMPQPKSNIWKLLDGGEWPADLPMTYTPKLKPIDYIKQDICLELPVKTINIIYDIEKEDVSKW